MHHQTTRLFVAGCATLLLGLTGCAKDKPAAPAHTAQDKPGEAAPNAASAAAGATATNAGAASNAKAESGDALAKIAPKGSKFDPAIPVSRVPKGAWYCDMGTVHYARIEKGDGICQLCGMRLKQRH